MNHFARKLVVCLLVCANLGVPAFAIFGIGDIVFDPSNFANAVEQLAQMERDYTQLVQTYQMVRNQYEHLRWMARQAPVNMASRYRALATPWRMSSATNRSGITSGWVAAINRGASAAVGYAEAVQELASYGGTLTKMPSDHLAKVKTAYATVELTDGANQHGIETLGRLRVNAPAVENAIQGLENDSLSSDPAMNTEIAVLNKINAANLISIRSVQDTNKLLVALAEEEIIAAKRQRDAEAYAINSHIRFLNEAKAVMAAQAAGASAAMRAWRMP